MFLKKKKTTNYSNYNNTNCLLYQPKKIYDIFKIIDFAKKKNIKLLCLGTSLSWYDTIQNKENIIIKLDRFKKKLVIDEVSCTLLATSNYKIKDLNNKLLKRNLALHSVPGSDDVTLGGCISHDVHGKDSFKYGNFSENIIEITFINSEKKIISVSKEKNFSLFKAICGGIGLLGIIIEVKIKLKKVSSIYKTEVIKCRNYLEIYKTLYKNISKYEYIYAWLDCSAKKSSLGRGIVFKSKESNENFSIKKNNNLFFFCDLIKKFQYIIFNFLLKKNYIQLINSIFWYTTKKKIKYQTYNEINYPIKYNNIDIKKAISPYSFREIQIILRKNTLPRDLYKFLIKCHDLNLIGFMVGIKIHKKNNNYISFNDEGISININQVLYKNKQTEILSKLKILNNFCIKNKYKIYICKDFLLNKKQIYKIYPKIKKFLFYKKRIDPYNIFRSDFSKRCELE
jgi:hypothetical protein